MTIVHVARLKDWRAALAAGEYRVSTAVASLDEVGYIHASEQHQVAGVLARFYANQHDLVLLVIDEASVAADGVEVRREAGGGGELFPHIYGAIRPHWVAEVRPL